MEAGAACLKAAMDRRSEVGRRLEGNWRDGFHIDQWGNSHYLRDMTRRHLEACIIFFSMDDWGLDVRPLKAELKRRLG